MAYKEAIGNIEGQVEKASSKTGISPIVFYFGAFFVIFSLIINIPPIPLPFTSNMLYIVNQPFAETAKFYMYTIMYFILIYAVFFGIYKFSAWVLNTHKKLMEQFQSFLEKLV